MSEPAPLLSNDQLCKLSPERLASVLRGLAQLSERGLLDLRAGLLSWGQLASLSVPQFEAAMRAALEAGPSFRLVPDFPSERVSWEGLGELTPEQLEVFGRLLEEPAP